MNATPQSAPCQACGAPMSEGEAYCPRCRSPRLVARTESSKAGIVLVILLIALGCLATALKAAGVL